MKYIYCLKIDLKNVKDMMGVLNTLKIKPTYFDENKWELELIERENDTYIDFINYFMDILEGNFETIEKYGIDRGDISIWVYYEYDEQCNLEILPSQMEKIGQNGISLCISCWQSGEANSVKESRG